MTTEEKHRALVQSLQDEINEGAFLISALKTDYEEVVSCLVCAVKMLCEECADGTPWSGKGISGSVCESLMRILHRHGRFQIEEDDDDGIRGQFCDD